MFSELQSVFSLCLSSFSTGSLLESKMIYMTERVQIKYIGV